MQARLKLVTQSQHFLIAVLSVALVAEISFVVEKMGWQSFAQAVLIARALILLNGAIAVAGLWTPQRLAWAGYLAASAVLAVLIGAVTPWSVIGIAGLLR